MGGKDKCKVTVIKSINQFVSKFALIFYIRKRPIDIRSMLRIVSPSTVS